MKITIIGSGYVGLVSGLCFAEFGFPVTCVDKDSHKIDQLKKGLSPIYEPGLEDLLTKNISLNRIFFTTNTDSSVKDADIVMLAVGTPSRRGDGHADLQYVFEATTDIAKHLNCYTVIVTKSTVPVGTAQKIVDIVKETRPELVEGVDFDVVSNPEFLREGSAIEDFMHPDRVVIGCRTEKSKKVLELLYKPLFVNQVPDLYTTPETAELIKYASNAFLATKISFINQMADLCEKTGADVQDLAKGMGLDKRIGPKFLHPSPGYGGSCFPKDTKALLETARENDYHCSIVEEVVHYNEIRKEHFSEKILKLCKINDIKNMSVLGITFKPNTDDLREAPSLHIIPKLIENGINVTLYDPLYNKNSKNLDTLFASNPIFKKANWSESSYEAIKNTSCVLILTEWNDFRGLDLEKIYYSMSKINNKNPFFIDLRNIYQLEEMKQFHYFSIGRGEGWP
ncbi:MAG: UDP-glucose/GDP-mannose dehydrogenase family protein [Gammaproteobacteria bacterium]|nr:UDP-glucose/GDP-mannose dehydrogenase family protein [Gammaproteobacteria bacterium]